MISKAASAFSNVLETMINKVILVGNLGKDPEVRHLESGAVVAQFPIATTESYKDRQSGEWKDSTEWHNIVCWRFLAERAEKFLRKGSQVFIEGKLTTRSWEDKDGNKRYTTEVLANNVRMLGKRDQNEGGGMDQVMSESPVQKPAQTINVEEQESDDLPF